MSFGADLDSSLRFWFFSVVTGLFLIGVAIALFRRRDLSTSGIVAMTLILGGGLGNLIDRLLFGSVTDFMIVGVGPLRTGIFNFADMAVVAGTLLLIFRPRVNYSPFK
jgi:signal peptidase II